MFTTLLTGLKATHVAAASVLVIGGASVAAAAEGLPSLGELLSEDVEEDLGEDAELDLDLPVEDGDEEEAREDDDLDATLDDDLEEGLDQDEQLEADDDEDGEPSAFAAWVESIPSDWGCVRGRLIAANAAGPKHDFEAPQGADTLEDAIATLGLDGARCAEVALRRAGGEDEETDVPDEVTTSEAPARRGPPAHAGGPPAHAGGAASSGEARGAGGPPAGRGGPPEGRGPRR